MYFHYEMSIKYKSERNTQLVRNDIFYNVPPPILGLLMDLKKINLFFCVMRALFCIW